MSMSHCLSNYLDLFYLDQRGQFKGWIIGFPNRKKIQSSESWRKRRMVPISPKFSPQEFMMVQYFCFSSLSSMAGDKI